MSGLTDGDIIFCTTLFSFSFTRISRSRPNESLFNSCLKTTSHIRIHKLTIMTFYIKPNQTLRLVSIRIWPDFSIPSVGPSVVLMKSIENSILSTNLNAQSYIALFNLFTHSVLTSFAKVLWVSSVCQKPQELEAKAAFLQGEEEEEGEGGEEEEVVSTLSMLCSASGLERSSADLEGVISIDQQWGAVCACEREGEREMEACNSAKQGENWNLH